MADRQQIVNDILKERKRFEERNGDGCNVCSPEVWLSGFMIEVGKLAREVYEAWSYEDQYSLNGMERLRDELVSLAATCVGWIEIVDEWMEEHEDEEDDAE